MGVMINGNEIVLHGTVGGGLWWDEDGFTAAEVIAALYQVGRNTDITVRLNSGGGIATEGAAIHAALAGHGGAVNVVIEGWAASAASLLAMAGNTITMSPGAIMMIHDPSGLTWGAADDHRATASALDALGDAYADIYAERAGISREEARALMKEELWLGPQEAVARGFADKVADGGNDNEETEPVAFGRLDAYERPPERIVALAKARGWAQPVGAQAAKPAASLTTQQPGKEPVMSGTPTPAGSKDTQPAPTNKPVDPSASAQPNLAALQANAAAIAKLCAEANVADMAAAMIEAGLSVDEARKRIEDAGEIRRICATAARLDPALDATALEREYLKPGATPQAVGHALLNRLAAKQAEAGEIANTLPAQAVAQPANPTGDHGWGAVVAKVNAAHGFGGKQ